MSTVRALAVFDFDGTMIPGDSIVSYLRFAYRRRLLSPAALLSAALCGIASRLGIISAGEAKHRSLRFLQRLSPDDRKQLDDDFATQLAGKIRPAALRQMENDRAEGRMIVLLSASTDNYMSIVAEQLSADALICTRLEDLPAGNCRGAEKPRRLQAYLDEHAITPDFAASAAYGDSAGDAPVLALVGHPALMNPSRRTLKKLGGRFPVVIWENGKESA